MNWRLVSLLPLALALADGPAGAAPDFAALQVEAYDPPKLAPVFALPDLTGQTVQLSDLRGKVVLVFFWATW